MKQKILKLLAAPALLLAAGITLSGCVKDIDGTNANYEEKKQEITDNLGTVDAAWTGYVALNSGYTIDRAGKQSHISIVIDSANKLDMTTVDSAITIYKLKDNTDNANYYLMHDGELVKSLVSTNSEGKKLNYNPNNYDDNGDPIYEQGIRTYLNYDVDTESVTTDTIAVIVDATKLKDVFGNLVLNLDENYRAGQESDSWIRYISVSRDKDGNSTTALSGVDENFRYPFMPIDPTSISGIMDNATGKVTFTIDALTVNEAGDAYDETLAPTMKQSFVLRTKGLEEAAYKDVALDWAYEAGQYKATTEVLPYGTQYSLVEIMTSFTSPEWITKVYGHPAFTDFYPAGAKEEIDSGESDVITEQPDYIIDNPAHPANSGDSWTVGPYDEDDVIDYQNGLLHVARSSTGNSKWISGYYDNQGIYHSGHYEYYYYYKWEITPETGVKLKTYDDFIVVGDNYNKLETEISYVKNSDDTIRTIYINLKNVVNGYTPTLWVGSGTILEENTAYPKQVKFGTPFKNILMGDASGYIPLSND